MERPLSMDLRDRVVDAIGGGHVSPRGGGTVRDQRVGGGAPPDRSGLLQPGYRRQGTYLRASAQ